MTAPAPRPFWQTYLIFLGPMMLSNVLQSMSGTINSVFLGRMIGVEALAAATVFFPVLFFFLALVIGLGAGASVLIGQAWGAKNIERLQAVGGAALTVALIGGTAVAILGWLMTRTLMTALGAPPEIFEAAVGYAQVVFISMPLVFVFILATSMLRGVGDTMTPLWALVISAVAGLLVTPALILGVGPLPALGVASAAWAGIVANLAGMTWMGWSLRRRKNPLAPSAALFHHMRPDPKILALIVRIGLPTGVQMVAVALSELVVLGLVNGYGSNATAAYGVFNQVFAYVQFPAMSIAIAASILGAQAIGAGQAERLGQITRAGLTLNLIITGGGVAIVYVLSRPLVSMFITDPAVLDMTVRLLRIVLWSAVLFGFSGTVAGVMRASGTVLAPMAFTLTTLLAVQLPVAWLLSARIGIEGIWWAYPVAFGTMLILQSAYYKFVWSRREIRALI